MKKLAFETKDVNGNPLKLEVRLPSASEKNKARILHAKTWRDCVSSGVTTRNELDKFLTDRGLWGKEQEEKYDALGKEIREKLLKLKMGGNAGLTKKTGKALALEIGKLRSDRNAIISERNSADNNSSESIADQAQFNFLVATCTLFGDGTSAGRPYFPSYDQFCERSEEVAAYESSIKFYELQNSQSVVAEATEGGEKVSDDLPEVSFLKEHGFANSDGQLIDHEGRLIDENGKWINKDGRYVSETGELVDYDGNPVNEKGDWQVESAPLLDD